MEHQTLECQLNHHLRCCNINNFGSGFRLQPVQHSSTEQLPLIEEGGLEASKMLLKMGNEQVNGITGGVSLLSENKLTLDLSKGLIAHYDFCEVIEKKVIDKSGCGNHAELNGSASILIDEHNQGRLNLDGQGYVKLPDTILRNLEEITVATWVKFKSVNVAMGEWQRLFDFGTEGEGNMFFSRNRKTRIATPKESVEIGGNGIDTDNEWTHIAVTLSSNNLIYYENGIEISRREAIANNITNLHKSINHYIGKSKFVVDPLLVAEINNFCIYDKVLSYEEVNSLMKGTVSKYNALQMAKESLHIEEMDEIVEDLILPTTSNLGVNIEWYSKIPEIIDTKGTVNRPTGEDHIKVTLKATLSIGDFKEEKVFEATVLPVGAKNLTVSIDADKHLFKISPTLIGIFYEDINHSADGGLYAELIENNSFEVSDDLLGWKIINEDGKGYVSIETDEPLNENNTHYVRMKASEEGGKVGLINNGYKGINVKNGCKYDFSIWARIVSKTKGELIVNLQDENGVVISETLTIYDIGEVWQKIEREITVFGDSDSASLVVYSKSKAVIDLDMVSLFPQDTWLNRKYGLRKDLMQMLADMQPGFLRFPGGCIVEGDCAETMYNWKDTIGKIEERKGNRNIWGYHQSYGLGFFEYFQLCEDIGAEPLPVINVGLACQIRTKYEVKMEDLDPFIQDALDLIEYANGDAASEWGSKRAESGHLEAFNLKYLAVGNEQWGQVYFERFEKFKKAINEKYPEIIIISSSGPAASGTEFDECWDYINKNARDTIVDEHYYMSPDWFLQNTHRYDSYDRSGAKVFLGEYAARSNSFKAALAEAAYLTGLERNSDLVVMASYAPLFAKYDDFQWTPDLVWFNGSECYGAPNYYIQKLFSTNLGTHYLSSFIDGYKGKEVSNGIYLSTSFNENSNEIIVKIVNATASAKYIDVNIHSLSTIVSTGIVERITADNVFDTNSFKEPKKVSVFSDCFNKFSNEFEFRSEKHSVSVLKIKKS